MGRINKNDYTTITWDSTGVDTWDATDVDLTKYIPTTDEVSSGFDINYTTFTTREIKTVPRRLRCKSRHHGGWEDEFFYECSLETGHTGDHMAFQHHDLTLPKPQVSWTNNSYGDDPFEGV